MELVLKSGHFGSPTISSDNIKSIVGSESRDSIGNIWTRALNAILDYVAGTERSSATKDMFDVFSKNSKCDDKDAVFQQLKNRMSPDFQGEFRQEKCTDGSTVYSIYIKGELLISSDMNLDVDTDVISDSDSESESDIEHTQIDDEPVLQHQNTSYKYHRPEPKTQNGGGVFHNRFDIFNNINE